MPTVNVSADLIKHMRRQIDLIRRMHAGRKMKYVLRGGRVVTHMDEVAQLLRLLTREYTQHVSRLHLKIAFHGDLVGTNKAANAAGEKVLKAIERFSRRADGVDPVVLRILSVEAHHFIPATSLREFPFLRFIFPDTPTGLPNPAMMPAVNLLRLEHQGPQHLIAKVANQVGVLGSARARPLTQNMTTRLNGIAREVSLMTGLNEKQMALTYLGKIEAFYDLEYADVGGGTKLLDMATDLPGEMAGWSARDWIIRVRNGVIGTPYP